MGVFPTHTTTVRRALADALDKFLLSGSPATNAEIAGQFGVHTRTVRKRRKRLRDQGLLAPGTDPEKLTVQGDAEEIRFTGLETLNPLDPTDTEGGAFTKVFELAGVDPADYRLVADSFKFSTWQQSKASNDGARDLVQLYSYRGTFQKRNHAIADELQRRLEQALQPTPPTMLGVFGAPAHANTHAHTPSGDPLIVNLADLQLGKTDSLGGLEELQERFDRLLGEIVALAAAERPREIVIADVGDICENVANNTSVDQASTNDLTLSEQMEWANRLVAQSIISLQPYTPKLTVLGVPSNHGADKLPNGKQNGHGDWGLTNILTLKNAFTALRPEWGIEFKVPEPYEVGVAHEVEGCTIVWVHGHLAGSADKMAQWLANQAANPGTIYARCAALFFGHFHRFSMLSSRGRDILGCPTLDSGSSWFTNRTGEWSRPGILTTRVRDGRVSGIRIFEA